MKTKWNLLLVIFVIMGLVGAGFTPAQAQEPVHYYVIPGGAGANDCTSWANACDLQTALVSATSGSEVWAAAGTYKPTTDTLDRLATFQLVSGVAVYGGFAGTEASRDERDPQANLTVLSGDLNGDDGEIFANSGENSYHVVTGVTGAILDGVTITAGNADYPASSDDLLLRYAGAGMYNQNSNPILSNITFSSNFARAGGGMYNYSSSPTLSNITFSGNSALSGGGGMYNSTSYPVIQNSIMWGDTGGEVVNNTSSPTITSSVVQDGCPEGATCTDVISADPLLGALGSYGGSTLTIPLLPGSAAIDAGDNSLCPATDQRGVTRVGVCDIGAFEYDYTGIYYVAPGGSGTQDGQSWANASDLQNALKTARGGDEIWVAEGVYKPTTDLADRAATFQLKDGLAVYGGFAGTETSRDERRPQDNLTVLSGDLNGDDGENFANNGENSYHVVTGADGALLDGVTITAGNANGTSPYSNGGGMFNDGSSPTLSSVTFSGNSASNGGGGMYNSSSSPTLTNVTFSGNSAYLGGGMLNSESSPTLSNVTFSGNSATLGGGTYNSSSSPTLTNVTFSRNSSATLGGGMYNSSSSPTLTNVTFSGNSSATLGGGMFNNSSSPTLSNVTFSGNSANNGGGMYNSRSRPTLTDVTFISNTATSGGAMYNYTSSFPVIQNTILWGDTGGEVVSVDTSSATITSSVVQGGCPERATCTYLISADPLLGALGSYGGSTETLPLLPGSSAIDMGDDSLCPATDQRGVARVGVCDIGAFESQGFTLTISGGDNQMAYPGAAFARPLEVMVSSAYAEPVDGGTVIFAAPDTGASASITGSPSTITDGKTSVTAVANNELGSYNVTASSSGAASVMFNLANNVLPPTANPGGPYLGAINTAIPFDGSASSDPEGASLTYAWDFGDGSTGTGPMPAHTYTTVGIYNACLTVNNGALDSESACTLAVVYDPSGGFVTGGGWIDSPQGAYVADPSLSGKATFGFVSKYLKGASVPSGNTEFQFQAGGFNFHSTSYDWLVVSKDQLTAQFKGSGTVNGALGPNGSAYKFMLWAGDGSPDTFRIKIWWEANGIEYVVYDNGFDQAIGGGSIVVHTGK